MKFRIRIRTSCFREEIFLNHMAEKGLLLTQISLFYLIIPFYIYHFEKKEITRVYHVDYKEFTDQKDKEEYIQIVNDSGFMEFKCISGRQNISGYLYFYTDNESELYSDEKSKAERDYVLGNKIINTGILFLLLSVVLVFFVNQGWIVTNVYWSYTGVGALFLLVIGLALKRRASKNLFS